MESNTCSTMQPTMIRPPSARMPLTTSVWNRWDGVWSRSMTARCVNFRRPAKVESPNCREDPLPADAQLDSPNPELLRILCCPICKGSLSRQPAEFYCRECRKTYPIVLGIPDLRVYEDPLIPLQDDYRKAEKLWIQAERLSFPELVRYYWSLPTYPDTPPDLRERFIR